MTRSERINKVISYFVLTGLIIVMTFPFFWMVLSSLKPFREIYRPYLFPKNPTLDNYKQILSSSLFPRWFLNSVLVALSTTFSVLFFDSLVGYTIAKYRFPGRNIIFIFILSTLMIPTEMLIIPWYIMSSRLGWIDSYWGIMFPGMITAFGIFLMRQFMETIPDDLLDAARIDGVSEFGIFYRIALPLVKPALASLAILNFIGNWNAFLWPLIVSSKPRMYTLPVGLAYFSSENMMHWELIMTGATISTIPLIIVFFIFQKQIIRGIMLSGLKG
ncbi:MAG TPA: carbohydrate ABC transporter permease [Pseudothermotoga sp.]|nr:carbohydrate ABC transporter permease [Pseudothermotoga sp.]HOK84619.1 carbohydrate ABC transporter permease [Pseudothermotoga sp.]HPP69457.1 carbohydrate ABC transporter permease [Pseudothermotoga sp.]